MKSQRSTAGVIVYPVNDNPYQKLLYDAVREAGAQRITFFKRYPKAGSLCFLAGVFGLRLSGRYQIVHLHWPALALPDWLDPHGRFTPATTRIGLHLLRRLGFYIVWTVHNTVPHERESSDDVEVLRLHAELSDAQILHSMRTRNELDDAGIHLSNAFVIPHGNYIGYYKANKICDETRAALQIDPGTFVFAFIGIVRPYKGVPLLVEAFEKAGLENAALIVAGENLGPPTVSANPNVHVFDRRLGDADLASILQIADVVCLPYLRVATSGSALLALSFGKPVIASSVGDLQDLPSECTWHFESGNVEELSGLLTLAATTDENTLCAMRASAQAAAADLDWATIARLTILAYASSTER